MSLPPDTTDENSKSTIINRSMRKRKKKKIATGASDAPSSSASSYCSTSHFSQRGVRVAMKQRNPRVQLGSDRRKEGDFEALALPLGMSIAAVVSQVMERKHAAGETMAADDLAKMCTSAVGEALANIFGNKFDSFLRSFEKSFQSTLMTLRIINECSRRPKENPRDSNKESCLPSVSTNDGSSFTFSSDVEACRAEVVDRRLERCCSMEEARRNTQGGSISQVLALCNETMNRQLSCVSPSHSLLNQSMFTTFERSVIEQTRSNDLKAYEISLSMKKLQLKEEQLALRSASNFLDRCKLYMGLSKASFKAEKFKTEQEELRQTELVKKCIDCLVAGLLIMLSSIAYGTYTYSHSRITEVTTSCKPSEVSKSSWWVPKPMSTFNSGMQILWCQVQVLSRMLFGLLMIVAIAYLLLQRATNATQTMPVTFLLLLGIACGFAGKLCIDTLGGSGYRWLLYWEVLCVSHFLSNIFASVLLRVLYGPVTVVREVGGRKTLFPFWIRRVLFFASLLVVIPLLCGLTPFASVAEWRDHFSSILVDSPLASVAEWKDQVLSILVDFLQSRVSQKMVKLPKKKETT